MTPNATAPTRVITVSRSLKPLMMRFLSKPASAREVSHGFQFSEAHLEVDVEDVPVRADRHRIRRVADRAVIHVDVLAVEPEPALFLEVPVPADAHLGRVAVVAEDLRSAQVELQEVLDRHRRRLQLVAGIADVVDT